MNKTFSLVVEPRTLVGHQTKQLRREDKIPGTLYGKNVESISVSVATENFLTVFKEAGETHIVNLVVGQKTYPVLIYSVAIHPVTRKISHVEFFNVNLKEKLKTQVPVRIVGESPAVKEGIGTLLTTLNEIEIEALPTNIPEGIDVDVSLLTEVNMEIKVKELKVPADVTIETDPELTVVKVGALVVEKEEPVAPTTESSDATTVETATPETATEDKPKEE